MPDTEVRDNAAPQQKEQPLQRQSPQSFLRRYKWNDLSVAEKEAVNDAMLLAATRAGVGLGIVLTLAGLTSTARRGQPPLPPLLRYGSLTFFSLAGAYAGFMSAGPAYAKRILSVPNSRLADDLRTVIEDWNSRGPVPTAEVEPHEALPEGPVGSGRGKDEIVARDPNVVRNEERRRAAKENGKNEVSKLSWTDRIGLTKP